MVCSKKGEERVISIMADKASGQMLLMFNHLGVGSVQYPSGAPWLVVKEDGWTVSDRVGNITERGKFPRMQPEPILCRVNECLSVTFQDRQSITATFTVEDVNKTFECGEKLRRTAGPNIDIARIRQRQQEVGLSGSVYVPPGPHHFKTDHPGLGGLQSALRTLPETSSVTLTVRDLQQLDTRLGGIDLMPKPSYGGAGSLGGTSGSSAAATLGATTGTTGRRGSTPLEDFGSPPMSATMRRLARKPKETPHIARRLRLRPISTAEAQRTVMNGADGAATTRDELVVLVMLADWSPVCTRLDAQLQLANCELTEEGAADAASASAHVQMFKIDASEGTVLQKKYGFRTVPMFLMFYEGRLVQATNSPGSASEIKAAALEALGRGRKGQFLPEGFSLNGRDNSSLDYINSSWSMLT